MLLSPRLFVGLSVLALVAAVPAADAPNSKLGTQNSKPSARPGRQADGSILLPNMWSLRPAGVQVDLANFPVNIALHPEGKLVAVLHAGYSAHEIAVVDIVKENRTYDQVFGDMKASRGDARLCLFP